MYRALQQETLDAIEAWEWTKNTFGSINSDATTEVSPTSRSANSSQTYIAVESFQKTPCRSTKDKMVNMAALEHALKWNPEPLQRFAALHNFAGENVSFLTHVTEWKQSWKSSKVQNFSLPSERFEACTKKRREQFNRAIRIYAIFVSMQYAEFPINLSGRKFVALEEMFERPANLLYGTVERFLQTDIAPFAYQNDMDGMPWVSWSDLYRDDLVWYWGPVPASFSENVFDDAEKEIRYLVLTNTWPKFVHDGCSDTTDTTLFRRFGRYLRRWS